MPIYFQEQPSMSVTRREVVAREVLLAHGDHSALRSSLGPEHLGGANRVLLFAGQPSISWGSKMSIENVTLFFENIHPFPLPRRAARTRRYGRPVGKGEVYENEKHNRFTPRFLKTFMHLLDNVAGSYGLEIPGSPFVARE